MRDYLLSNIWTAVVGLVFFVCLTLQTLKLGVFRRHLPTYHINKAPGIKLLIIVDFLFRSTTVELTFKPLIGEWQTEYFEALHQRRKHKALWITIRYHFIFACTFIKAIGLSKVFSLFRQLSK